MRPFDSGPGRKWLFFLFGAGTFAALGLVGAGRGDDLVLGLGRLLGASAFALAAWRAQQLRVTADDDGVVVRTWARTSRHPWDDVRAVAGTPQRPTLVLRDGREVAVLDSWHQDPEGVGVELRRRLQAAQARGGRPPGPG